MSEKGAWRILESSLLHSHFKTLDCQSRICCGFMLILPVDLCNLDGCFLDTVDKPDISGLNLSSLASKNHAKLHGGFVFSAIHSKFVVWFVISLIVELSALLFDIINSEAGLTW